MEILKALGLISGDTLDAFHITLFAVFLGILGLWLFIKNLINLQEPED